MKHILFGLLALVWLAGTSQSQLKVVEQGVILSQDESDTLTSGSTLDIRSNLGGVIFPRFTTQERDLIEDPAPGILIFNSDSSVYQYWNGADWTNMGLPPVFSIPQGLTATSEGIGKIRLTWTNESTEKQIEVFRSTTANFNPGATTKISTLSAGDSTYLDTGLEDNTTYYYKISYHKIKKYSNQSSAKTANPFVIRINTQNSGSSPNQYYLPLAWAPVDILVYWGDGTESIITSIYNPEIIHTYPSSGIYTVKIGGDKMMLRSDHGGDHLKLLEIQRWGDVVEIGYGNEFAGCANLVVSAGDFPQITGHSLAASFVGCSNFNPTNLNNWDVSRITDFGGTFFMCTTLNQDLHSWDVSRAKIMASMFAKTSAFNGNISTWRVDSVTNMNNMFQESAFNKNIAYNTSTGAWNVGRVTSMTGMFYGNTAFNQSIGNWDVSSVTSMERMFYNSSFNQPIGNWDVGSVTNMWEMFSYSHFNQDINNWDVSGVTNFTGMFTACPYFNQDLDEWDVSNATTLRDMFSFCPVFNGNISTWQTSNVTTIYGMFREAYAFNRDISVWDIHNVTNADYFEGGFSTQNLDALILSWANQEVQNNVVWRIANNYTHGGAVEAALNMLTNTNNWTIWN